MVAKESLRLLENNLVFARGVTRKYDDEFTGDRAIGDTLSIKVPSKYTVRSGAVASIQDHAPKSVSLTLDSQKGVDIAFTSKELALSLDDFSKEVLQPQIVQLANQIDYDGLALYYKIPNAVGVPGTIPSALKTYAQAGSKMDNESAPIDDQRSVILSSLSQVELIDAQKGLFHNQAEISKQYLKGQMGTAAGFDFSMSQSIPVHTVGAYVGTPLVNGAGQSGASLVTDGWTGSVTGLLKKGDVFTIDGVYAVNPLTRQSTTKLRQFVVTADVNSSAGAATLAIYPAMVASGADQNVTALPADNAPITVLGAASTVTPVNLAYHKDAFVLGTAQLPLPKGMDMASRISDRRTGLSIRFVRGYDVTNDKFISRLDVLYGWAVVRPEFACRVHA
jgi:hypothetical protein